MAFKMKGSPLQRNFNTGAKSPLEQEYVANVPEGSGIVRMDETNYQKGEGQTIIPYSKEAEAVHDANIRRLSGMDISADEMNAELAKTQHLQNPNLEVVPEPVYPKNEKTKKSKKRRKGVQIDFRKTKDARKGLGGRIGYKLIPKITRGGRGITFNQ